MSNIPEFAMCGPAEGPNIPHWDSVGRYLYHRIETTQKLLELWQKFNVGRKEWYCEVRGGVYSLTWFFTYRRIDGRFGDDTEIQHLVNEIETVLGEPLQWSWNAEPEGRIFINARHKPHLGIAIRTPWTQIKHMPTWFTQRLAQPPQ